MCAAMTPWNFAAAKEWEVAQFTTGARPVQPASTSWVARSAIFKDYTTSEVIEMAERDIIEIMRELLDNIRIDTRPSSFDEAVIALETRNYGRMAGGPLGVACGFAIAIADTVTSC
jgi:hypothetical protein